MRKKENSMRHIGVMNVLGMASISGAVHAAIAIVSAPAIAAVFLALAPRGVTDTTIETVMIVAVAAPLCWALVGFLFGGLVAFLHAVATTKPPIGIPAVLTVDSPQPEKARYAAGSQAA
jgi:hypothetical protein